MVKKDNDVPRKTRQTESSFSLVRLIVGLLLIVYGFLALTDPANYPLGPPDYSYIIALAFIGIGLFLILTRRNR